MEKYAFQQALQEIFRVLSRANKYIDETAPWVLAKDEAKKARLGSVLYHLVEAERVCVTLLKPFIPDSAEKFRVMLGVPADRFGWDDAQRWGVLAAGSVVRKGENVFPRIDMQKELAALEAIHEAQKPKGIRSIRAGKAVNGSPCCGRSRRVIGNARRRTPTTEAGSGWISIEMRPTGWISFPPGSPTTRST